MSINNSGNFDRIHRVEAIDPSQKYGDQQEERKKRKVNYLGRSWEKGEEELPLQPKSPPQEKKRDLVYRDPILLQKIETLYQSYTTLDDKIAGIFFLETPAYYDMTVQKYVETIIQSYKIGGLLFTKGEYKRQQYLIERFQALAQIRLLIGNDLMHGLTYYFQGDIKDLWGIEMMNVKYFSDLGRAVMAQNRHLGVHFQFTELRGREGIHFPIAEDLLKAFRKGIRDARGIISFFGHENKKFASISLDTPHAPTVFSGGEVKEIYSLKALTFFDMTTLSFEACCERLLTAFCNNAYDAFLFSHNQIDLISFISLAIKEGKISEKDIERRLMKILALNVKCR